MNSLEAHRELIEAYLAGLPLAEELTQDGEAAAIEVLGALEVEVRVGIRHPHRHRERRQRGALLLEPGKPPLRA